MIFFFYFLENYSRRVRKSLIKNSGLNNHLKFSRINVKNLISEEKFIITMTASVFPRVEDFEKQYMIAENTVLSHSKLTDKQIPGNLIVRTI